MLLREVEFSSRLGVSGRDHEESQERRKEEEPSWGSMGHEHMAMRAGLMEQRQPDRTDGK